MPPTWKTIQVLSKEHNGVVLETGATGRALLFVFGDSASRRKMTDNKRHKAGMSSSKRPDSLYLHNRNSPVSQEMLFFMSRLLAENMSSAIVRRKGIESSPLGGLRVDDNATLPRGHHGNQAMWKLRTKAPSSMRQALLRCTRDWFFAVEFV